jgi:malate dehydrogenase
MNNAPAVPANRWFAMMRLDENRAKSQLAQKAGVPWRDVTNMTIWGNHSNTQFPDFCNARIGGKLAPEVITDTAWLEGDFIKTVQERGAAIIKARGLSSAFSAAHAAIETVRSLANDTPSGDWHSVALCSDGSYGIEKGLICGFPTATKNGHASIVPRVPVNDFARARIDRTVDELKDEKAMVADLLPG